MKYLVLSLRPRQWIKNFFIFIPLIFGQRLFDQVAFLNTCIAFVLFSMVASAMYLANDIIDKKQDKNHRVKRFRPIASGKFKVKHAWMTAAILGSTALLLAHLRFSNLAFLLFLYIGFNLIYSRLLKEAVIIDVFSLGVFYLFALWFGTEVSGVAYSYWMISMVFLLSIFIGFMKRRQEIEYAGKSASKLRNVLKKYNPYFIDQMISVVTSSIVVVYMLYTLSDRTVEQFGSANLIYTIPFVYYGIFRYLYLVHLGRQGEDPTATLIRDKKMQINVIAWLGMCVAVIYYGL